MDKLTYYDTLGNLLPGTVLLWAIALMGRAIGVVVPLLLTSNTVVDSILFVAIGYVVGHLVQFLSRYSVEPTIRWVFWKGRFFSDIYLVSAFGRCSEVELRRFIGMAQSKLNFSTTDLAILRDPEVLSDERKKQVAIDLSRAIYRVLDARTLDAGIASKAHSQNAFYALFRNLSAVFLLVGIALAVGLSSGILTLSTGPVLATVLVLLAAIAFLVRAKQRGELYVKGLFWSYS